MERFVNWCVIQHQTQSTNCLLTNESPFNENIRKCKRRFNGTFLLICFRNVWFATFGVATSWNGFPNVQDWFETINISLFAAHRENTFISIHIGFQYNRACLSIKASSPCYDTPTSGSVNAGALGGATPNASCTMFFYPRPPPPAESRCSFSMA